MTKVKVTRNYRVTLPKEVRETVGVKEGDYLDVYIDERGRIIMEKVRKRRMRLASGRKLTPEEIEELVARGLSETLA